MGNIGSLGTVAYSIICDDETGKGLTAVSDNFRVTAGDVVASIKQISDAVAGFDDLNMDVGKNIAFTSASIGVSTEQIQAWANAASGPEDNIREMAGAILELTKAGVRSGEEIPGALAAWDNFADALGQDADKVVREWSPVMKSLGLDMADIGNIADRVSYTIHNTTLTSEDLIGVFKRMGPEMHAAGLGGEDVIDMLILLDSHGFKGKNAVQELNNAMSKSNDINKDGKVSREEILAYIERSPGEMANLTTEINNQSVGWEGTAANINNKYIPATEKVQNIQDNAIGSNSAYAGSITGIASAFSTVFEKLDFLIPFIAIKLPGAIAGSNLGAAISSALSGLGPTLGTVATTLGTSIVVGIGGGILLGLAGVFVLVKTGIMDQITKLGADFGEWLSGSDIGQVILDAIAILSSPFTSLFEGIFAAMKGEDVADAMLEPFEYAGDALERIMDDMKRTAVDGIIDIAQSFRGLGSAFSGISGQITAFAVSAFSGISGAFQGMAGQITGVFNQLMTAIQTAITSTAGGFFNAGQNIIVSMANGILAAFNAVKKPITDFFNWIASLIPHSPAKEGPLSQMPNWAGYLTDSMPAAEGKVKSGATSLVQAAAEEFTSPTTATPAAGGSNTSNVGGDTITFNIYQQPGQNAKDLADMVIRQFSDVRRQRGIRS